jgi:hypothetical protein
MQWPPRRSTTPTRRRPRRFSSHASTTFAPRVLEGSRHVRTSCLCSLRPHGINRDGTRELASPPHHSRTES